MQPMNLIWMSFTIHALLFIFLSSVYRGISNNKSDICDYFRALMFIINRFTKTNRACSGRRVLSPEDWDLFIKFSGLMSYFTNIHYQRIYEGKQNLQYLPYMGSIQNFYWFYQVIIFWWHVKKIDIFLFS